MGLDVHRKSWHLTVRTRDQEIQKMSWPPHWQALHKIIEGYGAQRTQVVYQAGYLGDSLHDLISAQGARCIVTPPS
jgi:phosphoglycolate phosphatase-like HAD superfamily hydrolase